MIKKLLIPIFLGSLILGCSENKDHNSSSPVEEPIDEGGYLEGHFVDSLVDGLNYKTESFEGVTVSGTYKYKEGETITFSLAGLEVGTVHGDSLITPLDFDQPLNLARILQTLDDDANVGNGIHINEEIQNSSALAGKGFAFIENLDENQNPIIYLTEFTSAGARSLVSKEDAQEHLYRNAAYAAIIKFVTNDISHELSSQLNYGYNQPYSSELLNLYPDLPKVNAGIDIVIPASTDIHSLSEGVVTRIKPSIGAVFIKPNQLSGTLVYMHLSEIAVEKDDIITRGSIIGKSGSTGTNFEYLHLEWVKDSSYLANDPDPAIPKEISRYNQGLEFDASDVTYDLKSFSIPISDNEALNFVGTWVMSYKDIPGIWDGSIYEALRINGENSRFSTTLSMESECGKMVATSQANVSLEKDGQRLKITFDEPLEHDYVSCDIDGTWLKSISYSEGAFIHYNISKSITNELALIDTGCSFTSYFESEPVCIVENQAFFKESSIYNADISLEEIPILMQLKGWSYASQLLNHWFDGQGKRIISSLETITDISQEGAEYIEKLEELAQTGRFLTSEIKKVLIKELKTTTNHNNEPVLTHGGNFNFIGSELEIAGENYNDYQWELDNLHFVNEHEINPPFHPLTEEVAALNKFAIRILLKGNVVINNNSTEIQVTQAGIYIRDSFDMIGRQHLGCWSSEAPYVKITALFDFLEYDCVGNADFRRYKELHNLSDAGDYLIFTDPTDKLIPISESFFVE